MADSKISSLAAAAALDGGEQLAGVQAGATVRIAAAQLAALARTPAVTRVAFATTVPLDGRTAMAQQVIAGPLAFAPPPAPVLGASCALRLIADGANVPAFPAGGFAEHGSSAGFLNVAGAINLVDVWFDGTTIWYAINQAANVAPFAAASGYVPAAAPTTATITYPYALNAASPPAPEAFAVAASGGPAAASAVAVGERTVTLTLARAIQGGETVRVTYTPPATRPLFDQNGNAVAASALALTNGVLPAGQAYLRLPLLTRMGESANIIGGYAYAGSGTGGFGQPGIAGTDAVLRAGEDGWIQCINPAPAALFGYMFGWSTAARVGGFGDVTYGVFVDTNYSANYGAMVGGGVVADVSGAKLAPAAGDLVRLRRASGAMVLEVSRDGGGTWTLVHAFAGTAGGALRPCIVSASDAATARLDRPRASANVG